MQISEQTAVSNVTKSFSLDASLKYYLLVYVLSCELETEIVTHAKYKQTLFSLWGMGNICGDGDVSEETTPEPDTFRRHRGDYRERYPRVHYFEENRLQDNAYRGKELDDSEPKCSCYGPTPDERFFIQRCPHPQVLNTTISKDLAEITEESKEKAQELRQERIHLIKQKVKEITGKDVDFDAGKGRLNS